MARSAVAKRPGATAANAPPLTPDIADPQQALGGQDDAAVIKNLVKPVSNAIRILRFLSERGEPARATQIAKALSINASTCFNILRTLVGERVVDFDPLGKTYAPGVGMLKLVDNTLTEGHRIAAARPLLHAFAEKGGVTATLWRQLGVNRIVLVSVEYTPGEMRVHLAPGAQLPRFIGATGRLFATHAGLSKAEVKSAFRGLRWKQALSFDDYWAQVELAAQRGWSIDEGYFTPGVTSIAAPIYDEGGAMAFSLSAVMFREQYDEAAIRRLVEEMLELAPQLGKILA